MTPDDKFNLIFECGRSVCTSYTGFSLSEMQYCYSKNNWLNIKSFLLADNPYEALINLDLNPINNNIIDYLSVFISSMFQFPDENENTRLENLLFIIDNQDYLDIALKNSKIIRALLALNSKFIKSSPYKFYSLFFNCKRVLAHIFKKYPDYLNLNILRSNRKHKSLRFTHEEIDKYF